MSSGTPPTRSATSITRFIPTIEIDKTTPRQHFMLNYSPSFTVYQHTSSRNQTDQYLNLNFLYRLSPHVTASLADNFQKTSSVLYHQSAFWGPVSGAPQPPLSPLSGRSEISSATSRMRN